MTVLEPTSAPMRSTGEVVLVAGLKLKPLCPSLDVHVRDILANGDTVPVSVKLICPASAIFLPDDGIFAVKLRVLF
jgi:hypothetical protein